MMIETTSAQTKRFCAFDRAALVRDPVRPATSSSATLLEKHTQRTNKATSLACSASLASRSIRRLSATSFRCHKRTGARQTVFEFVGRLFQRLHFLCVGVCEGRRRSSDKQHHRSFVVRQPARRRARCGVVSTRQTSRFRRPFAPGARRQSFDELRLVVALVELCVAIAPRHVDKLSSFDAIEPALSARRRRRATPPTRRAPCRCSPLPTCRLENTIMTFSSLAYQTVRPVRVSTFRRQTLVSAAAAQRSGNQRQSTRHKTKRKTDNTNQLFVLQLERCQFGVDVCRRCR